MTDQPSKIEAALALAARGFKVFPLQPESKLPIKGEGWKAMASGDEQKIRELWTRWPNANIAIATDGLLVVDVDEKSGKRGGESLDLLQMQHDSLPLTLIFRTPTGGRHMVFKTKDPIRNSAGKLGQGVDVRATGGYIVAPGSTTDKGVYAIRHDAPIADAPDWLIDLAGRKLTQKADAQIADHAEPDSDGNIVKAVAYLTDAAEPAIEGEGGNETTYRTAARLRDFGVTLNVAQALLTEHYNPRCEPPWSEDDLDQLALNAYKYGENAIGENSAAADFTEAGPDLVTYRPQPQDAPLTGAELQAGTFPEAAHLWESFLLKDHLNLVYGDGGTGKTLLLMSLAVAVAAGRPLFGRPTIQMPALLVLCEDDYGEAKRRLTRIAAQLDVQLEAIPLRIWCRPGQDNHIASIDDEGRWKKGPFYGALRAQLAITPCFAVLDTATDIAAINEVLRQPVNTFCKTVLGGLARETGATLAVTAHPSKAAMADGSHYAGSTAWNNAVRNRLSLEAAEKGSKRTLRVAKSNYGLAGKIDLFFDDGVFRAPGDGGDMPDLGAVERDAVFAVVKEMIEKGLTVVKTHGEGQRIRDVAAVLREEHGMDIPAKDIRDHLQALERGGRLAYEGADNRVRGRRAGFRLPRPDFDEVTDSGVAGLIG